jgi:thiamine-monophosphate kinase
VASRPPPDEFALIARHFAPLARDAPLAFGLTDDAAVIRPRVGQDMVVTTDTMVAGVHFLDDDPPGAIARKLLRVNLSDLAAKGARPVGYLLAATFTRAVTDDWLAAFAAGLAADQAEYGVALLGGDTTATDGPMVLTITACGEVPLGKMLPRGGAKAGDELFVSGTIGDAAVALAWRQGKLPRLPAAAADALRQRLLLPEPRLALGQGLLGVANACIDVSDGLVQDVGHLAECSGLACEIDVAATPLSPPVRALAQADGAWLDAALTGGDDYELAFAAPPAAAGAIAALAAALGLAITRIGRFATGAGVRVRDSRGAEMTFARRGYRHF